MIGMAPLRLVLTTLPILLSFIEGEKIDIKIGLVLPVHLPSGLVDNPCGEIVRSRETAVKFFEAFLEKINARLDNNFNLTFEIVDTCSTPSYALAQLTQWGVGRVARNDLDPPIAFIVSNGENDLTAALAVWLQQFAIPLIEFNSTAVELSDRNRYPLLARTISSDKVKAQVIAALVANVFEWSHVNLVFSRGIMGESGSQALRNELGKLDVSVAADFVVPTSTNIRERDYAKITHALDRSADVPGVVCFCTESDTLSLMQALSAAPKNQPSLLVITSASFRENFTFTTENLAPDGLVSIATIVPKVDPSKLAPKIAENEDAALGSLANAVLAGYHAVNTMLEDICPEEILKCNAALVRNSIRNGTHLYSRYLRNAMFDDDIFANSRRLPFQFDGNTEQPANYKFVLYYAHKANGSVTSEEFGDYSASRKYINLWCSDFVSTVLFTEQHVNCRRVDKTTAVFPSVPAPPSQLYSYGDETSNKDVMVLVSATSSLIFLVVSIAIVIYHVYRTKHQGEISGASVVAFRRSLAIDLGEAGTLPTISSSTNNRPSVIAADVPVGTSSHQQTITAASS